MNSATKHYFLKTICIFSFLFVLLWCIYKMHFNYFKWTHCISLQTVKQLLTLPVRGYNFTHLQIWKEFLTKKCCFFCQLYKDTLHVRSTSTWHPCHTGKHNGSKAYSSNATLIVLPLNINQLMSFCSTYIVLTQWAMWYCPE